MQYLFGRTVLLRFDFGVGGEKPIESRAGRYGKRAFRGSAPAGNVRLIERYKCIRNRRIL